MCSTYTDPDTICDSTCLATTSPTVTSSLQADGSVAVTTTDPVSGNVTVNVSKTEQNFRSRLQFVDSL